MIFYDNYTIGSVWNRSLAEHSDLPFLSSIKGNSFTYSGAGKISAAVSEVLVQNGIGKGDRVLLLSENRPEWGISYLAVTSIGAVAVPVLTDFSEEQIESICSHSGASVVITSQKMASRVTGHNGKMLVFEKDECFSAETTAISGCNNEVIKSLTDSVKPDDPASIIYTSGTTGTSKGVLLSHRNILTNTFDSRRVGKLEKGDAFLSVLPLAHMYEFTQGFMLPMIEGANITYLGSKPAPKLMMKAIGMVRPHYMLSVPLLIEKIYKSSVLPKITGSKKLSFFYAVPPFRKLLNRLVIGKKLKKTFGGRLKFFGIGGAPLSESVERFLKEARFPYAVGYGLTETSPCLAGSCAGKTPFRSIGKAFRNVELRIKNGEIQARGASVMLGYFRDERRTAEAFTADGWFRTGDLGEITSKGVLRIRGRLKSMILGPAGENIYPEEIENVIKANPFISECLVTLKGNALVARVMLDQEKLQEHFNNFRDSIPSAQKCKEDLLEGLRKTINSSLSSFSKIAKLIEQENPFEMTPSLKIKRYLYQ